MLTPVAGMDAGMRVVRFEHYGDINVLQIAEVPTPEAGPGRVVVAVRAAGINPGEAGIRVGALHDRFPATFPSGQGTDFAGVVHAIGSDVEGVAVGAEVLGWSEERSSHAEFVAVPASQVVPKPPAVPWEVAGSLFVASGAAYAAVHAVAPIAGQTVVVSGAAGGVGLLALQLLRDLGVTAIAVASPASQRLVEGFGAVQVSYGENLETDLRHAVPAGIDGWVDFFGGGYVEAAVRLGVAPEKIDTIIDFQAAQAHPGVQIKGTHDVGSAALLTELAGMVADGRLQVPIAATFPLEQVQAAFTELERRHTHGKIVLLP
jgi:NADPH:quinone reductase-like Zn-dependent oxidoreductase